MNKRSHKFGIVVALIAIALIGTGCPTEGDTSPTTGSITGVAKYSSGANHAGIVISLEKSDGLRTVSALAAARGANAARAVTSSAVTTADGSWAFDKVAPGTWTIYASSQNSKEKAVQTNVTVAAGRSVTAGELQLTPVGSIKGKVILDGTTMGNGGFLVFVTGTSYMAITADDGSFVISDVPAGDNYAILVMKGSYTGAWKYAKVTGGEEFDLGTKDISTTDVGSGGLVWKGELDAAPSNPAIGWAYYNKANGKSYIWDGTEWKILAQNGTSARFLFSVTADGDPVTPTTKLTFTFNENVPSFGPADVTFTGDADNDVSAISKSATMGNPAPGVYELGISSTANLTVTVIVSKDGYSFSQSKFGSIDVYQSPNFLNLDDVRAALAAMPDNTAATPYAITITGIDMANFANATDPLYYLFEAFEGKYVSVDISGCPMAAEDKTLGATDRLSRPNIDKLVSLVMPSYITAIGGQFMMQCSSLVSITLPSALTSVNAQWFSNCTALQSITLPDSIFNLNGNMLFQTCSSLREINLPANLTTIGNNQLAGGLSALTSITIPASVTTIGSAFLAGNPNLATVTMLSTTPPTLGASAFMQSNSLTAIKVPAASVDAYKAAANWSAKASIIVPIE
jgi:hypothetical protein